MESWRDTASQQTQDDLDELYNAGTDEAAFHLTKRGTLYPLMLMIGLDGELSTAMLDMGPSGPPDGAGVALLHWEHLWTIRADFRAAALVLDVFDRTARSDAISVASEHRDGLALTVTTLYTRRRFPKKLTLGEASLSAGQRTVWPDSGPNQTDNP